MTSPQRPSGPASPGRAGPPAVPEQRAAPEGAVAGVPVPARRRWGRARAVLAVLGGMAVLLCLGGLGIGYLLYDEATAPDRSAPDVAVDNHLRALLLERNDARARQHECGDAQGLQALYALRSEIEAQEQRLDTSITVSWGGLRAVDTAASEATVVTSIRRTANVDGGTQSLADEWRFRVAQEDGGWRVCAAEKVP